MATAASIGWREVTPSFARWVGKICRDEEVQMRRKIDDTASCIWMMRDQDDDKDENVNQDADDDKDEEADDKEMRQIPKYPNTKGSNRRDDNHDNMTTAP